MNLTFTILFFQLLFIRPLYTNFPFNEKSKDQSTMHISNLYFSHFKTMSPTQNNAIKLFCAIVPWHILNEKFGMWFFSHSFKATRLSLCGELKNLSCFVLHSLFHNWYSHPSVWASQIFRYHIPCHWMTWFVSIYSQLIHWSPIAQIDVRNATTFPFVFMKNNFTHLD